MSDQIKVGQVLKFKEYHDSPIVEREILSIEGDQVFYRKSETDPQGNRRIGQASMSALLRCIKNHGVNEVTTDAQ